MATKNSGKAAGSLNKQRAAQRRDGSRKPTSRSRQRASSRQRFSQLNIIGAITTVLVVLAIVAWAVYRSMSVAATPAALANPNALNPNPQLLPVGSVAPDFSLKDTSGTVHQLAAQRGHPVLLEFFAVWCPICQGEAPIMAQVTKDFTPKGVRVWSILSNPYARNYDNSGRTDLSLATLSDLSWFAKTFNVQHPQLIDPQFGTVNKYGITGYPGLYVIDPNGKIGYAADNHESYSTLAAQLNKALAVHGT